MRSAMEKVVVLPLKVTVSEVEGVTGGLVGMDMPGIEDCAARASGVMAKRMAARGCFMGIRVTRSGQKANAEDAKDAKVRGGILGRKVRAEWVR